MSRPKARAAAIRPPAAQRIAVVDVGTNSTRLLIADVHGDRIDERERRAQVTRLGAGVDATATLRRDAIERTLAVVDQYARAMAEDRATAAVAVMTSAVRDAGNGAQFAAELRARCGIEPRVLTGDEEAELTFLGATDGVAASPGRPLLVVDVGGGSTELVLGRAGSVEFHASTQAGVVRQSERHLRHDPPRDDELSDLAADARAVLAQATPASARDRAPVGIAVAGTPTSCAAIAQRLEPYDPARVHGFRLGLGECDRQLAALAAMPLAERRHVPGLHPDRAPTIVAGIAILVEAMRLFGLDEVVVSEHDILRGAALDHARRTSSHGA